MDYRDVRPGIHPELKLFGFDDIEQKIIKLWALEWYITSVRSSFYVDGGRSDYKYFLAKPSTNLQELFNIELEVIVLFSPYTELEPRSIMAFNVINEEQKFRTDKLCVALISKDSKVESSLERITTNYSETGVIVPFSYDDFLQHDDYLLRNRFKKYFFNRDLFAYESPLKSDLFFFGRNQLIMNLLDRHKSGENSGLFGLRKTGKTSLIYGLKRHLDKIEHFCFIIDCQDAAFHSRRWFEALEAVAKEIHDQLETPYISTQFDFCEKEAVKSFENVLKKIKKFNSKPILIVFDEIESISYKTSSRHHWAKDNDFIYFWQSLRSIFQRNTDLFTYLIVGTNPSCVEYPQINGIDNPIFKQINPEYIAGFEESDTREMVKTLGRRMGLKFDNVIFSKLTEDFGGHPFLIRHLCSIIHKTEDVDRPTKITTDVYDHAKEIFIQKHGDYFDMLMDVLKKYYDIRGGPKNLYNMLRWKKHIGGPHNVKSKTYPLLSRV